MEITFEVKNSTGIITLNRPKALNALNLNNAAFIVIPFIFLTL